MPFVNFFIFELVGTDYMKILQILSFLGSILILAQGTKSNKVRLPWYLLFYLLFIIYTFYSSFVLLDRPFKFDYLFSNRTVGGFFLMFIIENTYFSNSYYKKIFKLSKLILIVAVIVILIQQTVNKNFFVSPNVLEVFENDGDGVSSNEDRLYSIYSWLGPLAMGFCFSPILFLVVEDYLKKKNDLKVYIWLLLGIIFAFLTKHRWVMLNTFVVFCLLFIYYKKDIPLLFKKIITLILIIGFTYTTLNAVGVNAEGIVKDRILEGGGNKSLSQKSASTRILAFTAFGKLFMKRPFLGAGDYKYGMGGAGKNRYELKQILGRKSSQIHVGYLALLYRFGLLGGSMFLLFLISVLRRLYRNAKKHGHYACFFGMTAMLLANLTLVYFSMYELGLLIALLADKYFRDRYSEEQLNLNNV